jgi:hypothetical protein
MIFQGINVHVVAFLVAVPRIGALHSRKANGAGSAPEITYPNV